MAWGRISSAVLVQMNGWQRSFQPMKVLIAVNELLEAVEGAASVVVVMILKKTSTRLSQDPGRDEVQRDPWVLGQPLLGVLVLVGVVVVQ